MPTEDCDSLREAKRQLRLPLLIARASRSTAERAQAATALCVTALALPEVARAGTIACYVSMPQEPGTASLMDALATRGVRLLIPLLQDDSDLDWALHQPGALRRARFGISEPTGPPLGPEAVGEAEVVIAPALAVDLRGHRLGRGGGSYDRALSRLPPDSLRVVFVYDDEVLDAVPVDGHDEPVDVAVTPTRTLRLDAPPARRP